MSQRSSQSSVVMESIEGRTLLSAGPWSDGPSTLLDHSESVPASPAQFMPCLVVRGLRYINVVGTWTGTCKIATNRTEASCSIVITRQKDASATGTFSGAFAGGASVTSTAVVGTDKSFKVVLAGKSMYGGITATVTGKKTLQIVGRWSCIVGGKWRVGTLVLTKRS